MINIHNYCVQWLPTEPVDTVAMEHLMGESLPGGGLLVVEAEDKQRTVHLVQRLLVHWVLQQLLTQPSPSVSVHRMVKQV